MSNLPERFQKLWHGALNYSWPHRSGKLNYHYLGAMRQRSPMWARVVNNCMDTLNGAVAYARRCRIPVTERTLDKYSTVRVEGNRACRRIRRKVEGGAYRRPARPLWTYTDPDERAAAARNFERGPHYA